VPEYPSEHSTEAVDVPSAPEPEPGTPFTAEGSHEPEHPTVETDHQPEDLFECFNEEGDEDHGRNLEGIAIKALNTPTES